MKTPTARCDKCRFYKKDTGYEGNCHEVPPTFQRDEWNWPEVYGDAWCGKFAPLFDPKAACDMELKKSAPAKGE